MTVNYTTLLGLAKPVSGTESGTWGDTVNNNLTDYLDSAVAGAQIISGTQTAVTLSKTTGASLSQAGLSGITGSSQYQIIRCTGNPASLLTITAPAADKTYVVINATSTSQSVKIVGVGPTTTGVTIASGKTALVAWSVSDFIEITPSTISGILPVANGGTGATTLTGVLKGNGTSAFTAATSGTDYSAGTSALATGILKSTTSTGALTIAVAGDFPTLNQNTTGTAAGLSATLAITSGGTGSTSTTYCSLATNVTGTLPVANGGTGTTTPALVAGTNVTISGTWPNQTINASGGGGGTVTSVSGTAPISSSGGTAPEISIAQATTSTNGYLSSSDWNTFNGKYSTGGALGTPSSGTLSSCTADGTNGVGYRNIPQTGSDKTTAYTLVTGDVGKYVGVGSSGSIVVPTSTFANGDAISVYNNTTGNITITTSAPTAYIAGTNTVKTSITLATRGIATILFVSATVCVVTGNVS
jgi:hypothetical protein